MWMAVHGAVDLFSLSKHNVVCHCRAAHQHGIIHLFSRGQAQGCVGVLDGRLHERVQQLWRLQEHAHNELAELEELGLQRQYLVGCCSEEWGLASCSSASSGAGPGLARQAELIKLGLQRKERVG